MGVASSVIYDSNKIFYNDITDDKRLQLLNEFKRLYSNDYIKELFVYRDKYTTPRKYYIYIDKNKLVFNSEPDLIEFVYKLGRKFVFTEFAVDGYTISFVYGR